MPREGTGYDDCSIHSSFQFMDMALDIKVWGNSAAVAYIYVTD